MNSGLLGTELVDGAVFMVQVAEESVPLVLFVSIFVSIFRMKKIILLSLRLIVGS